jgi:hypothetical protein
VREVEAQGRDPIPVGGTPGREWRALADLIGPFSPTITVYILCGPALS